MRRAGAYLITAVIISVILGCSTVQDPPMESGQPDPISDAVEIPPLETVTEDSDSLDLSRYTQPDNNFTIKEGADSVYFENGEVTIISRKNTTGGQPSISSVVVNRGDETVVDIQLESRPREIISAMSSADGHYLAVQLEYDYGDVLILVDMEQKHFIILNKEFEAAKMGAVETIPVFNWSPDGHELLLSYGPLAEQRFAIYDPGQQLIFHVPTDMPFISTAFILWSADGKTADFVSEYPSDVFKLYRYDLQRNKVEEVREMDRSQFSSLVEYTPQRLDRHE